MRIVSGRDASALVKRLAARRTQFTRLEPQVKRIINSVRRKGDRSLRRYAQQWDGLNANQPLLVEESEMATALQSLGRQMRKSLSQAAQNIRRFCEWQMPSSWTRTRNGIALGQLVRPLESVGCYVPGGRYACAPTARWVPPVDRRL